MLLEVLPAPFYRGKELFAGPDIPIGAIRIERGPAFPAHRHGFTELVLVYAGRGVHLSGGVSRELGAGDVILVPRGVEHAYAEAGELSYLNLVFDESVLLDDPLAGAVALAEPPGRAAGARASVFRISASALREALALANRIDQELFRREAGYALMAKALFEQLWASLARERAWGLNDGESPEARVRRILERLTRDPSIGLSVEDMAAEARMSPRSFRREFKRVAGEPPLARANRLRIEEAKALLRETDKTVTQIGFLVGFDDPAYFARSFKRAAGVSPKAFRSSHG